MNSFWVCHVLILMMNNNWQVLKIGFFVGDPYSFPNIMILVVEFNRK